MSKLRLIQDFHLVGYAPSAQALFSAFVACLTPAETCQALDLTFTQSYEKRRAIVKKIVKDASSKIQDSHHELAVRKRGYKKLRYDWNHNFESVILEAWEENGDEDCAILIIEHFPVELLLDMFANLEEKVAGTWHFTKLYLRAAEADPSKLKILARKDGITYAYVLVKSGKSLKRNEA